MTAQNEEKMREEFEAHYAQPPYEWKFERYSDTHSWPGKYRNFSCECAWDAWQVVYKKIYESQKREAELRDENKKLQLDTLDLIASHFADKSTIENLRTTLSGQTCYVPPEFQAEMDELKRKLAEHQATIKEMEKQVTCDHDWHVQDDSFGHEFGTEIIVYDLCEKCGATKQCDEVDYDDL
jgi:hypothetical protein